MTVLISQEFRDVMNQLARGLDVALNRSRAPRTNGFVLLTFKFGEPDKVNYISNAERDDMLAAMKEFIARAEGRVQASGETH